MRLFIAIDLSEEIKDALMDIQDTMQTHGIRGRRTSPENMHLTLAFIGEFADPDLVKSAMERVEIRPFEIRLEGIGAFRDLWWAGLDDCPPLMAVTKRLRRALAEEDIPFDRKKFSPHITLMRRASGVLTDGSDEELTAHDGLAMMVDHISLMRSDRGKHGMIYTEL